MTDVTYTRQSRIARIHLHPPSGLFGPATRRDLHAALLRYRDDVDAWMAVISSEGADFARGSAEPARGSYHERREHAKLWAGGFVEMWKPTIAAIQGECRGEGLALVLACDVVELAAGAADLAVSDESLFPLHLSKPVIAAVEGPCYGLGFELALACDLRVAGHGAQFGFADPHLFVPYRVASVLLPRMTFLGKSLELIFSGRILGAAEMREAGLVSELAMAGAAATRAAELAHAMIRRFAGDRDFRKQAIWGLSGMPLPSAMRIARSVR